MNQLGIRLASKGEHEWRRNLFIGGGASNKKVKAKFTTISIRLGTNEPQLIA